MERRSVMVPSPDDASVKVPAIDIPIEESTERWSEIKLADGSVFRIKANVLTVAKLVDFVDKDGEPIYYVNAEPVVAMVVRGDDAEKESQL